MIRLKNFRTCAAAMLLAVGVSMSFTSSAIAGGDNDDGDDDTGACYDANATGGTGNLVDLIVFATGAIDICEDWEGLSRFNRNKSALYTEALVACVLRHNSRAQVQAAADGSRSLKNGVLNRAMRATGANLSTNYRTGQVNRFLRSC